MAHTAKSSSYDNFILLEITVKETHLLKIRNESLFRRIMVLLANTTALFSSIWKEFMFVKGFTFFL